MIAALHGVIASRRRSGYEAETIAYRDRVELEGGAVIDLDYVDAVYKKLKELSLLSNLKHWTSASAGVLKDASGYVSKLYSLGGASNEATQTTGASQPLLSSPDIIYDGTDDYLTGPALSGNQFSFISVFNADVVTKSGGQGLVSNYTGSEGALMWIKQTGDIAIGFVNTSGSLINCGNVAVTDAAKYIASGTYDKSALKFFLNGAKLGTEAATTADIQQSTRGIDFAQYWDGAAGHFLTGKQNEQVVFDIGLTEANTIALHDLINSKNLVY